MSKIKLKLPIIRRGRRSKDQEIEYRLSLMNFAETLKEVNRKMKDKVSSRGWCYLLEGFGLIDKSQFDFAQKIINICRENGLLPLDFVLKDDTRKFYNDEPLKPKYETPKEYLIGWLEYVRDVYEDKKDVSYWQSQKYYIQMMVEKIDVRNLFRKTCKEFHVRICNARGWSPLLTRAKLAWRFKEAEKMGLIPVLLYYADFDPVGILISDKIRKNLNDIKRGTKWDPKNLIIDKFGLTFDFIEKNKLTWIDNLMTSSGKPADERKQYVRDYIAKYKRRKVEANAILIIPDIAIDQCRDTILKYIDVKASKEEYDKIVSERVKEVKDLMDKIDYTKDINKIIEKIEEK